MSKPSQEEINRTSINLQTARINWHDLQRFFASGAAFFVSNELDLVDVAYQISKDNRAVVTEWMNAGQLARVTDEQAQDWYDKNMEMWAVVVSPYVLIQQA
jgi:hypothetical protein